MRPRAWVVATVVVGILLVASLLPAGEQSNEALFHQGVEALAKGDHGRAVAVFESLADRGFTHPDASYNRGMAYLARVRAKQGHPGDLGRAAAAFEEALLARPGDEGAVRALELIRAEVARRGPHSAGQTEMEVRPSLDRIIVGLVPEAVWAWLALAFSLALSVGLVLRRGSPTGTRRMAGIITVPIGLVGLVLFGSLAARARHVRHNMASAVVVAAKARILDASGTALPAEDPIPEAARVEVLERDGRLAHIRHGRREGWTHASSLRELALPRE